MVYYYLLKNPKRIKTLIPIPKLPLKRNNSFDFFGVLKHLVVWDVGAMGVKVGRGAGGLHLDERHSSVQAFARPRDESRSASARKT